MDRSLAKMKSAESSFELFLSEFPLDAAEPYPPVDKLVDRLCILVQSYSAGGLSAQRGGAVRKGIGKRSARQYIGALKNNFWCTKYAAFGELPYGERCGYWQAVFDRFDGMHAEASGTTVAADRVAQLILVAETGPVSVREHFYRTEVQQVQDTFLAEKVSVNWATISDSALSLIQASAARIGMLCKDQHDSKLVRWAKENPLRVRDIKYDVVPLVIYK